MKRIVLFAIAAATLSAAIPAAEAKGQPAGTTGRGGRTTTACFTSKIGKKATTCPAHPSGSAGTGGTNFLWP